MDSELSKKDEIKAEYFNDPEKFEKFLSGLKSISKALATRDHLSQIEKANKSDIMENFDRTYNVGLEMPDKIVPNPNTVKKVFYSWRCSDNKVFKTYEEYAEHQGKLKAAWCEKIGPIEQRGRELYAEERLIKEIKKDGESRQVDPLNRLIKLYNCQKDLRLIIFQSINESAENLLKTSPEFSEFRTTKKLIDEAKLEKAMEVRQTQQPKGQKRKF